MKKENAPSVESKTINEWIREAKKLPVPRGLFGDLWIEGELAVMFADTGVGKSVLALQIAEWIARGWALRPFNVKAPPQRVLYFDLELSDKQLEMRYSTEREPGRSKYLKEHYKFSDRLRRVKVDPSEPLQDGFRSFDEYLIGKIEENVQATGARVVIVDNISHVYRSGEGTRHAVRLMNRLNGLKATYGLSIMVLAHTRKRANSRKLTVGELQSSRALACLADSVFAIGQTTGDPTFRYLKHLKSRSTELVHDESCVPMFRITKLGRNFLGFHFQSFTTESEQTRDFPDDYDPEFVAEIKQLSESGMTIREIAYDYDLSKSCVHRMLHLPEPKQQAAVSSPSVPGPALSRQSGSEPHPSTPSGDGATQPIGTSSSAAQSVSPPEDGTQSAWYLPADDESEYDDREQDEEDSEEVEELESGGETIPPDPEAASSPPLSIVNSQLSIKLDGYGREIYVEKEDERGTPLIWYKIDSSGTIFRSVRGANGIIITVVDSLPQAHSPDFSLPP